METVFNWIDARPRRRVALRVAIYGLLLWLTIYVVYLLAFHFSDDTGGRPLLRDQFTLRDSGGKPSACA